MALTPSNGSESHGLETARVCSAGEEPQAYPQPSCHPEHSEGSAGGVSKDAARLIEAAWSKLPPGYRIPEVAPTLEQARAYCERLAGSHYENFSVATWFLPRRLRPHFHSVYAYCRISDDLGDEVDDPRQSLALLDLWQSELDATYDTLTTNATFASLETRKAKVETVRGPRHPVFIALRETIIACEVPREPFANLLQAFRQDQTVKRYETFEDVLGYCRYSADPVGRIVLYLCGYRDEERQRLADFTCTALQLANFWQDVTVDYAKGRIYLPLESLRRFGVGEDQIAERRFTPEFRELMRFEVNRARDLFHLGLPLVKQVDRELATDIELFSRGGLAILDAIERQDFNVLKSRPAISKSRQFWLVARAAMRRLVA
jgi:squalene synthase HpnC